MTTPKIKELTPNFEAVLFLHDDIVQALARIKSNQLLPADAAKQILEGEKYPYAQLTQPDGKPYLEVSTNTGVKRHYVFVDPDDASNASKMVVVTCSMTLGKDKENNHEIKVMPERISRGPEADFVMSVKYGCCSGGRTMIYSDTSATTQKVFVNIASSAGDVLENIIKMWANLPVSVLNAEGLKNVQQLAQRFNEQRAPGTVANNWVNKRPGSGFKP